MSDIYLIQDTTLTNIANAIRGGETVTSLAFDPDVIESKGIFIDGAVVDYYVEYIDTVLYSGDDKIEGGGDDEGEIVAYSYLENNLGVITPVIYKNTDTSFYQDPDYDEPYFYQGTADIDGVTYDKWRKIENSLDPIFIWDAEGKKYIYTNIIIQQTTTSAGSTITEKIVPSAFSTAFEETCAAILSDATSDGAFPEGGAASVASGKTIYGAGGQKITGTANIYSSNTGGELPLMVINGVSKTTPPSITNVTGGSSGYYPARSYYVDQGLGELEVAEYTTLKVAYTSYTSGTSAPNAYIIYPSVDTTTGAVTITTALSNRSNSSITLTVLCEAPIIVYTENTIAVGHQWLGCSTLTNAIIVGGTGTTSNAFAFKVDRDYEGEAVATLMVN